MRARNQFRRSAARRTPRPGFTLIEVLVVVTIIALLVAVLIPALSRAREQARSATCRSNAHQMALALTCYTIDHRRFPGHHLIPATAPPGTPASLQFEILWPPRLLRYVGRQHQIFWCPTAPKETYWDGRKRLLPYISWVSDPAREMGTFSYGYNDWGGVREFRLPHLGLGGHAGDPLHGEPAVERIRRPSEMIAIADNDVTRDNLRSQVYGTWDTAIDPGDRNELPGARHDKGANFAFADGHAESMRQDKARAPRKAMRMRWNSDFRDHCAEWDDVRPAEACKD